MTLTLGDVTKVFNDEAEAYKLVEAIRWPDGPICPHCGTKGEAHYIAPQGGASTRTRKRAGGSEKKSTSARRVWRCHACKKQFTVTVGTIFGDSHIPLGKWLMAFHLLCSGKNGVSAHELSRQLDITVKSAWFMAHRIRYAMERPPLADKLAGTVEADETYFGGAAKNMHKADRERRITGRGMVDKIPVVTLVNRETGEARSQVMRTVTGENIGKVLHEHVSPSASLMTDTASVYPKAGKQFASHETVDHSAGEYVRGNAYTNTAEGFFSQLKRSIDGTHHHISERHLPRYLAEFDFRYTTRDALDSERAEQAIRKSAGRRLAYR
jgi:transposase-like protein